METQKKRKIFWSGFCTVKAQLPRGGPNASRSSAQVRRHRASPTAHTAFSFPLVLLLTRCDLYSAVHLIRSVHCYPFTWVRISVAISIQQLQSTTAPQFFLFADRRPKKKCALRQSRCKLSSSTPHAFSRVIRYPPRIHRTLSLLIVSPFHSLCISPS